MSESTHTPGPIHANSAGVEGDTPGPVVRIVRIWGIGFTSSELADAVDDMRYIERAYNNHDTMLEALRAIVALSEDHGRMNLPECAGMARAAIAKATA